MINPKPSPESVALALDWVSLFNELENRAVTRVDALSLETLVARAKAFPTTLQELLDLMAISLAKDYVSGLLDFGKADYLANQLWGEASTAEFLLDNDFPKWLFKVYEAFDAGEYLPPKYPPGTDPVAKWTDPGLAEVLADYAKATAT